MNGEISPRADDELAAVDPNTDPAREYTDEYFRETFGLSREEADVPVQYRDYRGTMGQMLTDPGCPVGEDLKEEHQKGGRKAVIDRLTGYQSFFEGFKLGENGDLKAKDLPEELPSQAQESKKKVN